MEEVYATVLSSDSYLPGVLRLFDSLRRTGTQKQMLCLVVSTISGKSIQQLIVNHIPYQRIYPIAHPSPDQLSADDQYKANNYTKLRIFGLHEFTKIVYLDCDMIVFENIDVLFEWPHMSACNSGGEVEGFKTWKYFNSGLMVIEPSEKLMEDMLSKVGQIETVKNAGDQAFLHAYFPDWPHQTELHLPHRYNMLITHLENYMRELQYLLPPFYPTDNVEKRIAVLHYNGKNKPWSIKGLDRSITHYAHVLWSTRAEKETSS